MFDFRILLSTQFEDVRMKMTCKQAITKETIIHALKTYQIPQHDRFVSLFSCEEIRKFRSAAVFLPLLRHNGCWQVLLTQRAQSLVEHSGQVAFPGGARDITDDNLQGTALREMGEEIGVDPSDVQVFGHLGDMPVITGYMVRLFVGQIPWPYNLKINQNEVDSVFTVPLKWLADPAHRSTQNRVYGGREFPVIFFQDYHGHQLWGASAEMMMVFLKALESN